MDIIAEGIGNQKQPETLVVPAINNHQGNKLSPPLNAVEFIHFIATKNTNGKIPMKK
jgi:sensor c-di-GMP phosphodiesterase-like protein